MTSQRCPLCQQAATIAFVHERDVYLVDCEACVGYTISAAALHAFDRARRENDQEVLRQLPDVSAAARARHGYLDVDVPGWEAIAFEQRLQARRASSEG
jgi:Zn ribbon nucleic-acid-binding protein